MTDPTQPPETPFVSQEPIVERWDGSNWKTFDLAEMWVDTLNWSVMNAGISNATMRYECGRMATDTGQFRDVEPLDIDGQWLRTTVFGDDGSFFSWAGKVVGTREENRASDGGVKLITQRFDVQGMEFWLSRKQITNSVFDNVGVLGEIEMGLTFNAVTNPITGGQVLKGNKDITTLTFQGQSDLAEVWTGEDIVGYLRDYLPIGGAWDPWELEQENRLGWTKPVLNTHGRSLYEILTDLAGPRRACVCWIEYKPGLDENTFGTFVLKFDTTTANAIDLPSQGTIEPNANVKDLDTTLLRSAYTAITRDSKTKVRKVVAQGARAGAVLTVGTQDGTLEPGWRTQDENEYAAGDPAAGAIVDTSRRKRAHDSFRRQVYPDIYTRFHVPMTWDGTFTNQQGVIVQAFSGDLYIPDMKFNSFVPLKVGWDYASAIPTPTPAAPDVDDFIKPLVAFETNEGWEIAENFSTVIDEISGVNGYEFGVVVRPLSNRLGFSIRATTANHVIADNKAQPVLPGTSEYVKQLDYTKMLVTAYTQGHSFAQGEFPDVVAENEDIHYLRLGETAFFDFMPAGTVVAISGGNPILSTQDMFLRDDREYLEDVARMAFEWYGKDRYASSLQFQQIYTDLQPGQFLENIDDVPANAIVSSLAINFRDQQTEVLTDFNAPDFATLGGGAGGRTPTAPGPGPPSAGILPPPTIGRRLGQMRGRG